MTEQRVAGKPEGVSPRICVLILRQKFVHRFRSVSTKSSGNFPFLGADSHAKISSCCMYGDNSVKEIQEVDDAAKRLLSVAMTRLAF
jgi:hypothetical protein